MRSALSARQTTLSFTSQFIFVVLKVNARIELPLFLLQDYVQQMNEQLGGSGLDGLAGLPQGLLANLADGLSGTNLLSNLDSLLSILSPETAGMNAVGNDAPAVSSAHVPSHSMANQQPQQQQQQQHRPMGQIGSSAMVTRHLRLV